MDRHDIRRQTRRIPVPEFSSYMKVWNEKSLEELMLLESKLSDALAAAVGNESLVQQYQSILRNLQKYNKKRLEIQGASKPGRNNIGI